MKNNSDRIGPHQHPGDQPRQHQELQRRHRHRLERVDLLGDAHRPELGGDAGARAPGHHQRRQHRRQLDGERLAGGAAGERLELELPERVDHLQATSPCR
jgi:hypothetical protein